MMRATVLAFLLWVGLVFAALALAGGCGGAAVPAPAVPIKVVTETKIERCMRSPPPRWEKVGSAVECQSGVACYPRDRYAVLVADIEALKKWAKDMVTLCAPAPEVK